VRRPAGGAAPDGRALYARLCAGCHGPSGEGTALGKPIDARGEEAAVRIADTIRRGVKGTPMPAYAGTLREAEIEAIARHLVTLRRQPSR
jgi:mono/diheme cytochrome c family protein